MAEERIPQAHDGTAQLHHEESDADTRGILAFGGALIVTGVVIFFAVWVLFKFFDAREAHRESPLYPLAAARDRVPPGPQLQTNPREDMRELRAREEAILTTYEWVDRNTGIVRIPIEEAMKLTVERGLPVRQERK
jgi:hypothetical protein